MPLPAAPLRGNRQHDVRPPGPENLAERVGLRYVAMGDSYSAASGGLPPGLSFVGGALAGTPTEETARRSYKIKAENYRSKVNK